ncbi:MAG: GAF domain-containing protein [Actinobacteria bacterium]|nr:GAF domain-containing protein [Actinomycetota bacterium]
MKKKKTLLFKTFILIFLLTLLSGCKNEAFESFGFLFGGESKVLRNQSLPDMPLYPGSLNIFYLETINPEGSAKVASVIYQTQEEPVKIANFYASKMTQYGWKKKSFESKIIKEGAKNYFITFTKSNTISQITILGEKRIQSSIIQIAFYGKYKKTSVEDLYISPPVKAWRYFMSFPLWARYVFIIFLLGALYFIFGENLLYYKMVIFKEILFYSFIVAVYSAFYFYFVRKMEKIFFGQSVFILFGFLILIVVSFTPLRRIILRLIESVFFREEYKYREFLNKFSQTLSFLSDINSLSDKIVQMMGESIKLKNISLFLYEEDKDEFKLMSSRGLPEFVSTGLALKRKKDTLLNKWKCEDTEDFKVIWQTSEKDIFSKDKIFISTIDAVKENEQFYERVISIPLRGRDKLIGLLNLGRKISSRRFSSEDLSFFADIADKIGVSLENSRVYQNAIDKEFKSQ